VKIALRLLLSVGIAVLLVALLLYWGDLSLAEIGDTLGKLDSDVYWTALGVQLLIYPLRALRFRMLLPGNIGRPSTMRLLPIAAAHNMAAVLVPAKVGEAALVVYLRSVCSVPAARGTAVLLVSRILDLAAVTGTIGVACLVLAANGEHGELGLGALGASLSVLTLVLAWFSARSERLVAAVRGVAHLLRLERTRPGARLNELAGSLGVALGEVGKARLGVSAVLSVPIWLCVFSFYAILARGFGLELLPFAEAVFGAGLAVLSNLLPIHGFAGFGTLEAGWVLGFTALDVPRDLAVSSALAVHLVYLANIIVLGLIGHAGMALLPRRTQPVG